MGTKTDQNRLTDQKDSKLRQLFASFNSKNIQQVIKGLEMGIINHFGGLNSFVHRS